MRFNVAPPLSEDQHLQQIKSRLTDFLQKLPGEARPMAFWDFDGTIIDGDISEGAENAYPGLIDEVLMRGKPTSSLYSQGPQGKEKFWREYQRMLSLNQKKEAYVFMAKVLSNLSPEDHSFISRLAEDLLQNSLRNYFFTSTLSLIQFLHEREVEQFIISASPQIFVRPSAVVLPIPPQNIFGLNEDTENGASQGKRIDPFTNYGKGKAERMLHLLQNSGPKGFPLLAAGNSWISDGPMCEEAVKKGGFGLLINPGNDRPDESLSQNLFIMKMKQLAGV